MAPPGYGKSSLALDNAYLRKQKNENVIRFDADSTKKVKQ